MDDEDFDWSELRGWDDDDDCDAVTMAFPPINPVKPKAKDTIDAVLTKSRTNRRTRRLSGSNSLGSLVYPASDDSESIVHPTSCHLDTSVLTVAIHSPPKSSILEPVAVITSSVPSTSPLAKPLSVYKYTNPHLQTSPPKSLKPPTMMAHVVTSMPVSTECSTTISLASSDVPSPSKSNKSPLKPLEPVTTHSKHSSLYSSVSASRRRSLDLQMVDTSKTTSALLQSLERLNSYAVSSSTTSSGPSHRQSLRLWRS